MRILITGVSGFVGGQTAIAAIRAGHEVLALGREPLSDAMKEIGVIEINCPEWPVRISTSGPSELIDQFAELDAVIHLAGDAHYGNGAHYYQANVVPTELLVKSVKYKNLNCRFVYASSVGAQDFPRVASTRFHDENTQPLPRSDYGKSKLAAEKVVIESGIDYAIARLGMIVGPGMRKDSHVAVLLASSPSSFFRKALSLWQGVLPLVHIDDAVDALLLISRPVTPAGTYLVVGTNMPIRQILNTDSAQRSITGVLGLNLIAGLIPAKLATATSPVMRFNSGKLKEVGWMPRRNLDDTIESINDNRHNLKSGLQVITGVGSGLGRAIMEEVVRNGGQIVGIDRNVYAIEQLKVQYPSQTFLCKDTTDPDLFDQVQRISLAKGIAITSLYLVAGLGHKSLFVIQEFDQVRNQFEVNVMARLSLAQKFLQYLSQTKMGGSLVIVSSSTALQPLPGFAAYSATNAALLAFGRSLIMETNSTLCRILISVPGGMATNFQQSAGVRRIKGERLMDASLVARKMVRSASKKSRVRIIGRNARLAQAVSKLVPWKMADAIWNKVAKLTR